MPLNPTGQTVNPLTRTVIPQPFHTIPQAGNNTFTNVIQDFPGVTERANNITRQRAEEVNNIIPPVPNTVTNIIKKWSQCADKTIPHVTENAFNSSNSGIKDTLDCMPEGNNRAFDCVPDAGEYLFDTLPGKLPVSRKYAADKVN